jgi:hypothetical protein
VFPVPAGLFTLDPPPDPPGFPDPPLLHPYPPPAEVIDENIEGFPFVAFCGESLVLPFPPAPTVTE